tara:strand:+ start:22033 stop:22404 length:372 start_codon:yes stop_codon:yes gene_type:complete
MHTTEVDLGSWDKPVNRIVDHFGFQGGKKQTLLKDVALFKNLESKYGRFGFNGITRILEINKSDVNSLSVAAKILGFRGEYKVCKPDNVGRVSDKEFDICIVRKQNHVNLAKTIDATYLLRAF